MIIYKLISPSGKIYIGQTSSNLELRFNQHINAWKKWSKNKTRKGFCTKLFYGFESYSPETWTKEIIYQTTLKEDLDEKESYFIKLYDSINNGYNITKGGNGRKVDLLDEDHKQNISMAKKQFFETEEGKQWKEEFSKKYSGEGNPTFGKRYKKSDEAKKLISEKMKGKNIGKIPWNKGTKALEETKIKNSNSIKKRHEEGRYNHLDMSSIVSKDWLITDPNGNEKIITNLKRFCEENNLNYSFMVQVSKGKYKQYKKWVCKKL